MTTTPDYERICEKLEASFEGAFGELINPDGPEAAQAIRTLMGEKAELVAALERISRAKGDRYSEIEAWELRDMARTALRALTGRGAGE